MFILETETPREGALFPPRVEFLDLFILFYLSCWVFRGALSRPLFVN